jgi:hypothetical protein
MKVRQFKAVYGGKKFTCPEFNKHKGKLIKNSNFDFYANMRDRAGKLTYSYTELEVKE